MFLCTLNIRLVSAVMSDNHSSVTTSLSLSDKGHAVVVVAAFLAIFLIDLHVSLGLAAGALYAPVVLYTAFLQRPRVTLLAGFVAAVAIGIGFIASPPAPPGFPILYVWVNRIISVLVVAIVTWLVMDHTRLQHQRRQLEARIDSLSAGFTEQQQLLFAARAVGGLGHWVYDLVSGSVTWSDDVAQIYGAPPGYSPDTIEAALDFFVEHDRTYVKTAFHTARVEAEPFQVDAQINTVDGRVLWVRAVGLPVVNSEGRVVRIQGALQDITARKIADRVTSVGLQRFQQLAESMPIMVWTATPEGRVDYVTPLFFKYTGLPGRSLSSDQWLSFVHSDDQANVLAEWSRCVASGEKYEVQQRLRRADGVYRWHLARAVRVKEITGLKWYGSLTDVHDHLQNQIERNLFDSRLRQVQRVDAMAKLTQATTQEVNRLLSDILPLASQLVTSLSDQPELSVSAQRIFDAGHRGLELTNHLLEFTSHYPLDPKPLIASDVIRSMQPLLDRAIAKNIQLRVISAPDVWPILLDATLLEEMILTLVLNACDAMPDGGVLTIETANVVRSEDTCHPTEEGGVFTDYLSLAVSDTGHGISEYARPRIFEPFFTTKTSSAGTGLGLPMVYRFVKQAEGDVHVETVVGKGTKVTLYFPKASQTL